MKLFAHECYSATLHLLTMLEMDQDRGGTGQLVHGLHLFDTSSLKLLSCQKCSFKIFNILLSVCVNLLNCTDARLINSASLLHLLLGVKGVTQSLPVCVELPCSPSVCVGSPPVLLLPPRV